MQTPCGICLPLTVRVYRTPGARGGSLRRWSKEEDENGNLVAYRPFGAGFLSGVSRRVRGSPDDRARRRHGARLAARVDRDLCRGGPAGRAGTPLRTDAAEDPTHHATTGGRCPAAPVRNPLAP